MSLFGLSGFQQITLLAIALALCATFIAVIRGRARPGEALLLAFVLASAAAAIAWPEATSRIAHALGIGRGADLVLYSTVVAMGVGFWMVYIRLRQLRREITLLVRHLALLVAQGQIPSTGSKPRQGNPTTDAPPTREPDSEHPSP
jgi:hypothetical protein